jgi:hypothetical protein
MDRVCSTNVGQRNVCSVLVGNKMERDHYEGQDIVGSIIYIYIFIYLLPTAIGPMPGGSVT